MHRILGTTECIANYLDGGFMRSVWCLSHSSSLFLLLIALLFLTKPVWLLWPGKCIQLLLSIIFLIISSYGIAQNLFHLTTRYLIWIKRIKFAIWIKYQEISELYRTNRFSTFDAIIVCSRISNFDDGNNTKDTWSTGWSSGYRIRCRICYLSDGSHFQLVFHLCLVALLLVCWGETVNHSIQTYFIQS